MHICTYVSTIDMGGVRKKIIATTCNFALKHTRKQANKHKHGTRDSTYTSKYTYTHKHTYTYTHIHTVIYQTQNKNK